MSNDVADVEPGPADRVVGEGPAIPAEEERLLARVLESLAARAAGGPAGKGPQKRGYADEMMALRDD